MRASRRAFLGLGAGLAASRPLLALGAADDVTPIEIEAIPIASFSARDRERRRFGPLTFRAGLVLRSEFRDFGGLSGLWRSADGAEIVALSDRAMWLTARAAHRDGRLVGLEGAVMAPILGVDARPLRRTRAFDTEALAIADGVAYVGIERVHEVRRFDWAGAGVRARGIPIPTPPEVKRLPSNESLEAVGIPPRGHPLAGAVIAIAERARSGDEAPTRGWVLTGPRRFAFDVVRRDGFDVTDLAFLPSGEALLLERRYRLLSGVACRIRRLPVDAFRPDGPADGPTILDVDLAYEIDNMEGIAVHRDPTSGETVVTLVSDDNFSFIQRTVLLEFGLAEG